MKHPSGWLVTAMALAAGFGYWFGSTWLAKPTNQDQPVTDTRYHKKRQTITPDKETPVREFMEKALTGVSDERSQWQQIRWLSEEEVKVAIAELTNAKSEDYEFYSLASMLFYRWGELNPVEAVQKAKAMYPEHFQLPVQAVYTAWINQGGADEAWKMASKDVAMWDCTQSVRGGVAEMIASSLLKQNYKNAFNEVARMNDDNSEIADILCRISASRAFASEELRNDFLLAAKSHPEPFVQNCAVEFLFRYWANNNPDEAKAGMLSMQLTEEQRKNALYEIESAQRRREK